MKPDPHGCRLMAERVAAVPGWVARMLEHPFQPRRARSRGIRRVMATGIGSSEAQARYFVWLLNHFTDVAARFVPLADFMEPVGSLARGCALAVFSQGLSANSQFALRQAGAFGHTLVFTAATEAGQKAAGRPERVGLLRWLRLRGAEFVRFPVEDEYTILIRLIGPACGFVAAHQFVASVPGSRLRPLRADGMPLLEWSSCGAVAGLVEALLHHRADWQRGSLFLLPAPLVEFSQNISCKFVEGLFWAAPQIVELMQFAHGPFQQLVRSPRPVLMVEGSRECDRRLAHGARIMLGSAGIQPVMLPLNSQPDQAPIALELILNPVFRDLARALGTDQVAWPGKGLDGPLYQLCPTSLRTLPSP